MHGLDKNGFLDKPDLKQWTVVLLDSYCKDSCMDEGGEVWERGSVVFRRRCCEAFSFNATVNSIIEANISWWLVVSVNKNSVINM
jgi:hypothetical protein